MHSNGDNGQWAVQVFGQRPASKEQVAIYSFHVHHRVACIFREIVRFNSLCSIPIAILAMGDAAGF